MSNKLIGRFYFKRTINGNLIGEFSNNNTLIKGNSTESADLIKHIEKFNGEYNSSWFEDGAARFAKLTITTNAARKDIYNLTWEHNNKIIYWGEAFICDDILIGDYRNFKDVV